MARNLSYNQNNFKINQFVSEEDFKAERLSCEIPSPKINNSIRDRSCLITFPMGVSENKITRVVVEEMMSEKWGDLYKHVVNLGNVDFNRKWIFTFDSEANCDLAVQKTIFINEKRVKAIHATKKFNSLKISYIPLWVCLDDLAEIIKSVPGISGRFVDSRWARGDNVNKDSSQAIFRFYADKSIEFNPPPYVHYFDEYGQRVFLHLSVFGKTTRCMKCGDEGHHAGNCPYFFCPSCNTMQEKGNHKCTFKKFDKKNDINQVIAEESNILSKNPENNLSNIPLVINNDTNEEIANLLENDSSFDIEKTVSRTETNFINSRSPPKKITSNANLHIPNWEFLNGKKRGLTSPSTPETSQEKENSPKRLKETASWSEVASSTNTKCASSPLSMIREMHEPKSPPISPIEKNSLSIEEYPPLGNSSDKKEISENSSEDSSITRNMKSIFSHK